MAGEVRILMTDRGAGGVVFRKFVPEDDDGVVIDDLGMYTVETLMSAKRLDDTEYAEVIVKSVRYAHGEAEPRYAVYFFADDTGQFGKYAVDLIVSEFDCLSAAMRFAADKLSVHGL